MPKRTYATAFDAASAGDLPALKRMCANGCTLTGVCEAAAEKGQLRVLRWAHSQGAPWGHVCLVAARTGHLRILQWVRERGAPWNQRCVEMAARNGHADVVRWMCLNGVQLTGLLTTLVAMHCDLDTLRLVHERGAPWTDTVCELSIWSGLHMERCDIARWVVTNGAIVGDAFYWTVANDVLADALWFYTAAQPDERANLRLQMCQDDLYANQRHKYLSWFLPALWRLRRAVATLERLWQLRKLRKKRAVRVIAYAWLRRTCRPCTGTSFERLAAGWHGRLAQ